MKPARIHEPEAGWGRKLDYMPAPLAVMAGAIAGVSAGIAAALMAPWPGVLVFAGMIAVSVGLAARARAITVLVEAQLVAAFGSPDHVSAPQKTLIQMNVQLHRVIRGITGVTGCISSVRSSTRAPAIVALAETAGAALGVWPSVIRRGPGTDVGPRSSR